MVNCVYFDPTCSCPVSYGSGSWGPRDMACLGQSTGYVNCIYSMSNDILVIIKL